MKKECIFRLSFGGEWYYVYAVQLSGVNITKVFRVYKGRRWLNHIAFYTKRLAVEGCIAAALKTRVSIMGGGEV